MAPLNAPPSLTAFKPPAECHVESMFFSLGPLPCHPPLQFAGAAQSLGAGAILVNPWNVVDVAGAIEDALTMPEEERVERHRYNFMHVTTHTAQAWADTFVR